MNPRKLFSIQNESAFNSVALEVFKLQAKECPVYNDYLHFLNVKPDQINDVSNIPFLPIEFFKSHQIFSSSGTTGSQTSKHYVSDLSIYEESFRTGFELFYGDTANVAILALLPSYLERTGSSLIYMVDDLIKSSQCLESGYFLYNYDELYETLVSLKAKKTPTILFGVTYALLDFIEKNPIEFPELIVMETGGMKGKRKEIIRQELHEILCSGFGVPTIHAEYGMTELLSQAYSKGNGLFDCPPWMKVFIRDINDPFSYLERGISGGINIIDLANINSCSFISTQDLGRKYQNNQFEVLGRFDQSDVRGCNLMIQ
jgi:hypothetical protein